LWIPREYRPRVTSDRFPFTPERHAGCPHHAALIERRGGQIVYLCQNPAEAGHIRQRQAWEREDEPISPEEEERRAQGAEAAERQRAERAEALQVAAKVRHDFTHDLLQRPGLGGKAAALDAARFVVAAMWEFMAEAYDWGPDELAEFADLIRVSIDKQPTWGQQQQAVVAAIREMRRVDDLAGVLLAMHAVRVEPTLADEDWNEDGVALVAFLTTQGYQPSPVECELIDRIVPMRAIEAADLRNERPSDGEEDAAT
jgi:ParB family chromosome partitioning protein